MWPSYWGRERRWNKETEVRGQETEVRSHESGDESQRVRIRGLISKIPNIRRQAPYQAETRSIQSTVRVKKANPPFEFVPFGFSLLCF
jgi:hypothetical protein